MTAAFLDENLPDGTRLRPGTKFIKYWKMRNTGTMSWNADTKVRNFLGLFFRRANGEVPAWNIQESAVSEKPKPTQSKLLPFCMFNCPF